MPISTSENGRGAVDIHLINLYGGNTMTVYDVEITTLASGHIIYAGHDDGLTFLLFDRGERGEAGYVVRDEDAEFFDDLLEQESPGSFFNGVKDELEVKPLAKAYPQALGTAEKRTAVIPANMSAEAIWERLNEDTVIEAIVDGGIDPAGMYIILPGDTEDSVLDAVRTAVAGASPLERGRVLRGQTPGSNALWVANIGGLVLNFTVDEGEEEPEPEPEPATNLSAMFNQEEQSTSKQVREKLNTGNKGKNHQRQAMFADTKRREEALLIALHHCLARVTEDAGIPVVVNLPYDVYEAVEPVMREYDIPVYAGKGKPPPNHVGVIILTDE